MKETNLNTIIANSFKYYGGVANKIPDPMHGTGIQNPFDGFGAFNKKPLYWEAKLIKKEFTSFNFNIIEDHQAFYLEQYTNLISQSYGLYILGYYVPRQVKGIFIFDSKFINKYRNDSNTVFNSIKKKDLLKLKERYFININYISIDGKRKELIDFDQANLKESFEDKIIYEENYFSEIKR